MICFDRILGEMAGGGSMEKQTTKQVVLGETTVRGVAGAKGFLQESLVVCSARSPPLGICSKKFLAGTRLAQLSPALRDWAKKVLPLESLGVD